MQNENEPGDGGGLDSPDDVVEAEAVAKGLVAPPGPTGVQTTASSPVTMKPAADQTPVVGREILAVALLVALCDVTIYRGHGFAGYSLLFAAAPLLLLMGSYRPRASLASWIVAAMLVLLAGKMLWYGTGLLLAAGFALLVAFAACLSGRLPDVMTVVLFASQAVRAGFEGLLHYCRSILLPIPRLRWLNVLLPLAALLLYGVIFILANPEVVALFSEQAEQLFRTLRDWLLIFSPFEVAFCMGALWMAVGLLRPGADELSERASADQEPDGPELPLSPALFYPAFRNTLMTVIALFAVYLVFEFQTLWFREFEIGFHYSGYAHEGAAWLTFALALATAMLSLIFRGQLLRDPRLHTLRGLAWIWSIQNLVLALAVFNRMFIYINFNGMTRLRTIALFGISTVVVGFILVLWKIHHNRDFTWLVRRHLWTLSCAAYLYAMTPVDAIVVSYNVQRILAGDPAPSVAISVHPISPEGLLLLRPLLESDDLIIREGIAAMFAQRAEEAEELANTRGRKGWTTLQLADRMVLGGVRASGEQWQAFTVDRERRASALERFHKYAYQWY